MCQEVLLNLPDYVQEVLGVLGKKGYRGYVVGGAIRDSLLGIPVRDWDIATDAPIGKILTLFPRVIPTGAHHGTATVRMFGNNIEVSTFRGSDILEDLARRDFTIDAMAFDPDTFTLLDPFGGREDIKRRILKAVGSPQERFGEDPLRALRGIRLAGELGFDLDPNTKEAMAQSQCTPERISVERIRGELERILLLSRPEAALCLLWETGLIQGVIPELRCMEPKEGPRGQPWAHVVGTVVRVPQVLPLRWAGLLHRLGTKGSPDEWRGPQVMGARISAHVLMRLRASRRVLEDTSQVIKHHAIEPKWDSHDAQARILVCALGNPLALWALELRFASLEAHLGECPETEMIKGLLERVRALISNPSALRSLVPVLNGEDVMELLGIGPGPKVGEIMGVMRAMVARNPKLNTREELTRWLKEEFLSGS